MHPPSKTADRPADHEDSHEGQGYHYSSFHFLPQPSTTLKEDEHAAPSGPPFAGRPALQPDACTVAAF